MDYTHLGRTGLRVSRLVLGTMNFGELTDAAESVRIMDATLEAGINMFDTADVYGGPNSPDMPKGWGRSEEIIGRWLREDASRRDRIVPRPPAWGPGRAGPSVTRAPSHVLPS